MFRASGSGEGLSARLIHREVGEVRRGGGCVRERVECGHGMGEGTCGFNTLGGGANAVKEKDKLEHRDEG